MNSLLLEVVLSRTPRLTAWERTFVVPLASVDTRVPCKMAARRKRAVAGPAYVLLLSASSGSLCSRCHRRRHSS